MLSILGVFITQVSGAAECIITRKNNYELCDVCTLINGETMINENDFIGNSSGTVTSILYYGTLTLPHIPVGLFKLFPMVNDVVIRSGNFKEITYRTFENAKRLWFLTLMDTKSLTSIAPDSFNDCQRLEYLTVANHSLTTLNFHYSFPILKQLDISWNPLNAVNQTWYQSLPNNSIFFDFRTCVNTTGLNQALVYRIPGEPRFKHCFENFAIVSVQTTTTTTTTTSMIPPPIVNCKFQNHRTFGYTCVLSNVLVENFIIAGSHLAGKTDNDVTGVVFLRSQLKKVSSVIFDKFSKLAYLDASNLGISLADSSSFEVCGNLKYLDLSDNDIITIESGFLENCQALETIYIENNLVNRIYPCNNFLKTLKNLVEVSLDFNQCIEENGYFNDEALSSKYQQTFVKPLMNCFTNYLDPPVAPVLLRKREKQL